VRLVGPELHTTLPIAEHAYGRGRAIVRGQSTRAAMRQAAARGFTVPVSSEVPLPCGQWVAIGRARLRFTTRCHLGDASDHSVGSLQVNCGGGEGANARVVEMLANRRSASAVAFAAPRATSFVVGVMEEGGGEGSGYFGTWYLHVDLRRVCGSP